MQSKTFLPSPLLKGRGRILVSPRANQALTAAGSRWRIHETTDSCSLSPAEGEGQGEGEMRRQSINETNAVSVSTRNASLLPSFESERTLTIRL